MQAEPEEEHAERRSEAAVLVFSPAVGLELPRRRTAALSSPPQGGPAPKPP